MFEKWQEADPMRRSTKQVHGRNVLLARYRDWPGEKESLGFAGVGKGRLIQASADLGEPRIGTGFVLVAARRAANSDAADDLVASLDRDPTARDHHVGVVEGGIERPWRRDRLGHLYCRDPSYGRRISFARGQLAGQRIRPFADQKHFEIAGAVHDRGCNAIALRLA